MTTKTDVYSEYAVEIPVDSRKLSGTLTLPHDAKGLVLFAHGSGSSRRSPRNQFVAGILHDEGIGTLLFDLLEESEAQDRTNVFDINMLAQRLKAATAWAHQQPDTSKRRRGTGSGCTATESSGGCSLTWRPARPGEQFSGPGGSPNAARCRQQ